MLDDVMARPLPHSPEAEASLLGALLLDPQRLVEVRERIRADDFSRESHKLIYQVVCDLADAGTQPSFQTVVERLRERGELEQAGGSASLVALIESTPAAAHVRGYATVVERTALLRRLIKAAQEIARLGLTRSDAQEAMQRAQQLLFEVGESRLHREVVSVGRALRDLFESLDLLAERGVERALPTGFATLDELLGGGLHPGDLAIVAGRPGLGKTTLAVNIARNIALRREAKCAIFSLEMTEEDLTLRLLSSLAEIDGSRLRRGALDEDELQAISQASSQLMRRGIYIEECTRLTVPDILAHSRKLQARDGLDLIVIDYLQLMEGAGGDEENRVQEIGSISRGLKAVSRELGVPVIAVSQLSRQIERRAGGEPKLSDLRECVTGDTRVVDADTGRWVEVCSLNPGMSILAMDKDQRIRPFTLGDVWSTGVKPVFRMISQTGREIRATPNHPFFTFNGWTPLEALRPGDVIATAMRLPPHGQDRPQLSARCRLLGYLAGDGSYLEGSHVGFSSSDAETYADVVGIVQAEWPDVQERRQDLVEDCYVAEFARPYADGHGRKHGNPLREWLRELGIFGQIAWAKRVPDFVFEAGESGIREYLAGYLATDGCVKFRRRGQGSRYSVHFDTTSRQLARDVQALLLRLAIVSYLSDGHFNSKSTRPIYRLTVSTAKDNLDRFISVVGVRGEKAPLLARLRAELPGSETDSRPYGLPRELSAHLASLGVGWRDQGKRMRRSTARWYAAETGDAMLRVFEQSDLLWEEIREIAPAGEEEVFDLFVPGAGTFIADGFVVKNSGALEQDADIVLFLWRRDRKQEEPIPVIDVRLAKHRNGPTGDFQLVFEYEYARFRDLSAA